MIQDNYTDKGTFQIINEFFGNDHLSDNFNTCIMEISPKTTYTFDLNLLHPVILKCEYIYFKFSKDYSL